MSAGITGLGSEVMGYIRGAVLSNISIATTFSNYSALLLPLFKESHHSIEL